MATAFLAASRGGDLGALVAVLDEGVTLTADVFASPGGKPERRQGAQAVSRGALAAATRAGSSRLALVDGDVGIVFAPAGQLRIVLKLTVSSERKITVMDIIGDPDVLRRLRLAVLPE